MLNEEKNELTTNFIMGEVTEETNAQKEKESITMPSERKENQQDEKEYSRYGNAAYATAYQEPQNNWVQNQNWEAKGNSYQNKKKKGGKAKKFVSFLAKAAVFGLVAGAAFTGITYAAGRVGLIPEKIIGSNGETPKIPATVTANTSATVISSVADIVEQALPSVVSVVSRGSASVTYGPFYMGTQEYNSSGSGFIVGQNDTELLIVTNHHVIDAAQTITVTFSDATPADQTDDISVDAILKGSSAENDLAVLAVPLDRIPEEVMSFVKVATLGNSDNLRVGEGTIAIGNALGYGQSVTTGVVSALNREVNVENISYHAIQTSAAINQGNSGGALLNMNGEVIGINSAKTSSSGYSGTIVEGMGYAIPISDAIDIINDLMNRETVIVERRTEIVDASEQGYLGISAVDTSSSYATLYGIPTGISIQEVEEGSPAAQAGIQKYDIITKFDGISINSMSDLRNLMQYYRAGETVKVTLEYAQGRNQYVENEVEVTLGKKPESVSR